MLIATKTLAAINEALMVDQGAKFRGLLKDLMPLAGDAYDTKNEEFRTHLGASLIGKECSRELWYSFRWATSKKFDGRILRLFNRGHLEEPRMIALLLLIGCEVWQHDSNGQQFRIKGHRGHFGGSTDGVAKGIPDLPEEACVLEFKTHNDNSFADLTLRGVLSTKWEHFVQQQIYMGKMGLNWSLYMAVNKNNDALHAELIQFDSIIYNKYLDRSMTIIEALIPPPKINKSASWYKCRICNHKAVCHEIKVYPARNCRTCVHSRIEDAGEWVCTEPTADAAYGDNVPLTPAAQRAGCDMYEANPAFKG